MSKQSKSTLSPEQVIQHILEFADQALERAITENNHKSSCVRGCAFCCHQPVFITPLEALAISLAVEKMLPQELKRLEGRIDSYLETLHTRPHMMEGVEATQTDLCGLGPGPTGVQFTALYGPACPFLDGGECSVYESRPLMCREHTSLDDPAKCERDEPFFGLPAALFNEVPAALSNDIVPDEILFVPVWEYELAVSFVKELPPIEKDFLDQVLSWKLQALGL